MKKVEEAASVDVQILYHGSKLSKAEVASKLFVQRPRMVFGVTFSIALALSAYVFLQGYFTIENTTQFDWYVAESDASKASDALAAARDLTDIARNLSSAASSNFRSQEAEYFRINIIYEWADEDRADVIITPRNVQLFCEFERHFIGVDSYKKFCVTEKAEGLNTTCKFVATDIVQQFYPDPPSQVACELLNQSAFDLLFISFFNNPGSIFFFDKKFPNSTRTRSTIGLGGPLGPDSTLDGVGHSVILDSNSGAQYSSYRNFFDGFEQRVLAAYDIEGSLFNSPYLVGRIPLGTGADVVHVRYESIYFRDREFFRVVETDQLLVGGAVVFVLIMMYLHLKSAFLAFSGIVNIVLALPVALFIYRVIVGIDYFNSVHVIAIFLLLGVGADNIFVFVDAWKQSAVLWTNYRGIQTREEARKRNVYGTNDEELEVLIARLSYTYSRSSGAILNTSSTTAAAFFATASSPIVPVAAFGIYAAIAIIVNFVWLLVLQPTLVMIHHFYVKDCSLFGQCCTKKSKEDGEDVDENKSEESQCVSPDEFLIHRGYIPLMASSRFVAVFCAVSLTAVIALMGYSAVQLPVPSTQEEQFREDHMFTGFIADYIELFLGGAAVEFMSVELFWGIKGQDRSQYQRFDPNGFRGSPIFDESFDIAPSAAQEYLLDTCVKLRNYSCIDAESGDKPVGCTSDDDYLIFPNEVNCFIEEFHSWHAVNFPFGPNATNLGDSDPQEFNNRLLEFTVQSSQNLDPSKNYQLDVGFIDGKVKFVVIDFVSTLKRFRASGVKEPFFGVMDQLLEELRADAPPTMKSILQTSFDLIWINTELGIVSGMFTGLAISLPIAFVVLLFASANIVLATFSIISIVGIVSTVLGTAYFIGWSLGIGEAISAVMVIGLSVDYVIHLSHMYVVAGKQGVDDREGRYLFAAAKMGPTVVAGAVTTAGSCSVMFFCELTVFSKMAALIVMTIAFSVVYALFFFLTSVKVIGPEKDVGQLDTYVRYACRAGEAVGRSQAVEHGQSL